LTAWGEKKAEKARARFSGPESDGLLPVSLQQQMEATIALIVGTALAAAAAAPPNSWSHRPQFLPVCNTG